MCICKCKCKCICKRMCAFVYVYLWSISIYLDHVFSYLYLYLYPNNYAYIYIYLYLYLDLYIIFIYSIYPFFHISICLYIHISTTYTSRGNSCSEISTENRFFTTHWQRKSGKNWQEGQNRSSPFFQSKARKIHGIRSLKNSRVWPVLMYASFARHLLHPNCSRWTFITLSYISYK
jgi:hypothetical protein